MENKFTKGQRVLVKEDEYDSCWKEGLYLVYDEDDETHYCEVLVWSDYWYITESHFSLCKPYEGNEHLSHRKMFWSDWI